MQNSFMITIVSLIVVTFIIAFIRKRICDKCLKAFANNLVILEKTNGEKLSGVLHVESTGLEFICSAEQRESPGNECERHIFYKNEYPGIQALIRYHSEMDERSRKLREKELNQTYRPGVLRKLARRVQNIFKTVRDSFVDVLNLVIGQVKQKASMGGVLASQEKHTSKVQQELIGSMGTACEPLLDKHIGRKVILEFTRGSDKAEYKGILKEYTAEFLSVMDIDFSSKEDSPGRKADLVVPRKFGIIHKICE